MAYCSERNCRCVLPYHAKFCPRCGRRVAKGGGAFVVAMLVGFIGLAIVGLLTMARIEARPSDGSESLLSTVQSHSRAVEVSPHHMPAP